MWRISALDRDGREVGRFELVGGELTIGRDADRQLVLPSASVSRRHARVYLEGGQPCIVDEGIGQRRDRRRRAHHAADLRRPRARASTSPSSTWQLEPLAAPPIRCRRRVPRMTPVPGTVPSPEPAMRLVAEGGPYDGRVFELTARRAGGRARGRQRHRARRSVAVAQARASSTARGPARARGRGSRHRRTAPSSTSARSGAARRIRATRCASASSAFASRATRCTAPAP